MQTNHITGNTFIIIYLLDLCVFFEICAQKFKYDYILSRCYAASPIIFFKNCGSTDNLETAR